MSLSQFDNLPGVTAQPDAATREFVFNHTMLRVKNIETSLDFYTRVLGFTVVDHKDFPDAKFSLTFLALVERNQVPEEPEARQRWRHLDASEVLAVTRRTPCCIDPFAPARLFRREGAVAKRF